MMYPHKANTWLHYALTDGLQTKDLVTNNSVYQQYIAERDEIEKHKWLESEKVGNDIGFEKALMDWISHHRTAWRKAKQIK
jgi:hypothetical protein